MEEIGDKPPPITSQDDVRQILKSDGAADDLATRRMTNGDKVRMMQRLRRIIEALNQSCDEDFAVITSLPDPSKHLSFFGSRRLVKICYNSNIIRELKENTDKQDKTTIYMPVANIVAEKTELSNAVGESELYGKVTHLLDLYNYPSREHFSYKGKLKPSHLRPKPDFWPRDIKFISLMGYNIADITEPFSTQMYVTRKDIIRKVLAATRGHYKTFVDRMNGVSPEDELVDIEHIGDGLRKCDKHSENGKRRNSLQKLTSKRPALGADRSIPLTKINPSGVLDLPDKNENALLPSSSRNVWFVQPGTSTEGSPPSTSFGNRWTSNSVRYEIKRPPGDEEVINAPAQQLQPQGAESRRYIINGQEYTVVDSLGPSDEVFYEYDDTGVDDSFLPGSTDNDPNSLQMPLSSEWKDERKGDGSVTDFLLNATFSSQTQYEEDEVSKRLVRTVVVNKPSGPTLQKFVVKMRKE